MMNLIQKEYDGAPLGLRFGHGPAALPKSRESGIRVIAGGINRRISEMAGDVEKQSGFAYLEWSSQKLNTSRSRFTHPLQECLVNCLIVKYRVKQIRLICH